MGNIAVESGNAAFRIRRRLGQSLTLGLLEALGRSIVTGQYRARPFPTEAQLADSYGVSRSVTREAVKMLCAKGLLGTRVSQGRYVQPDRALNLLDTDILRWQLERETCRETLLQFAALRLAIEPNAAALAARTRDPVAMSDLTGRLQQLRGALAGSDDPLPSQIAFHRSVLQASGNPFFAQLRDTLAIAMSTGARRTVGASAPWQGHGRAYADLHNAILHGDEAAAADRMRSLVTPAGRNAT